MAIIAFGVMADYDGLVAPSLNIYTAHFSYNIKVYDSILIL